MQKSALTFTLVLLISISLFKGGVLQWASLSWASLSFVFLTAHTAFYQGGLKPLLTFIKSPAISSLVLFQGWALLQFLTPISKNTNASIDSVIFGLGILSFLYLLYISLQEKNNLKILYTTLIAFGLIQALYGLAVLLSGQNQLLWMDKVYYLDRPTGTFVNPNHYAAYLSLILILLISNLAACDQKINTQSRKWSFYDKVVSPSSIIILVLLLSVLMTKSIGAIGSMLIITLLAGVAIIRTQNLKSTLSLCAIGVSFFLIFIFSIDLSTIENELSGLSHTIERRFALSAASWDLVTNHWLAGVGGGAFYSVFSKFRSLEVGNAFYNYAHNDYLQFWAEYGIIGMILLASFILFALKENIQVLRFSKDPLHRAFAYTSVYGSIGLGIHSCVDFSLHIPAYATVYICIISTNVITRLNSPATPPTTYSSPS